MCTKKKFSGRILVHWKSNDTVFYVHKLMQTMKTHNAKIDFNLVRSLFCTFLKTAHFPKHTNILIVFPYFKC